MRFDVSPKVHSNYVILREERRRLGDKLKDLEAKQAEIEGHIGQV